VPLRTVVPQGEPKNQPPFNRPASQPQSVVRAALNRALATRRPSAPAKPPPVSPADQAANAALAPLYTQQSQEAKAQQDAIRNYTAAIMRALGSLPGQVAGDYNQAIGQQTNLANAAADSLRAANPNTQDQALLSAINAPQEQHDAIANQLGQVFNGGAAVGQYLNGVLPASTLRGQQLTAETLARLQPGIEGLRGAQALAGALLQQREARSKIDSQRPDLVYKYQQQEAAVANAKATQAARQQQLALEREALGLRGQNQAFSQKATVARIQQADRRISNQQAQWIASQNRQVAEFNARQSTAQDKLKLPSASLSAKLGYLVDSTGNPIPDANGHLRMLPGGANRRGGLTPYQGAKLRQAAAKQIETFYYGVSPSQHYDASTGKFIEVPGTGTPALNYTQAVKRLMAQFSLTRRQAQALANQYWAPGEDGRPNLPPPKPTPDRGFRDAKLK
jgi:hypothetical protein